MSGFSDYLEKAILNASLRGIAFPTPPTTVHVALFMGSPLDTGAGGAEFNPTVSTGYARFSMAHADWSAPAASSPTTASTCVNLVEVAFGPATADWEGTATHFAIFDASTGGNMLYHGPLKSPRDVVTTDILRYAPGSLIVGAH